MSSFAAFTYWPLYFVVTGGGGGIRTHGRLPFTRFPSVPVRPLSHSSKTGTTKCNTGTQGYPSPAGGGTASLFRPRLKAVVGSRATAVRESSQGRKPAALSGLCRVPRIA